MLDEVQADGVEATTEDADDLDAMPEEAPDQPQAETPPSDTPAEPPAPDGGAPPEGYDPAEVAKWKETSENYHKWAKSNTEEAQRIADERRTIDADKQQIAAFQSDPVARKVWESYQRVQQDPSLLENLNAFNQWAAQQGVGQQPAPLVNELYGKVQGLEQQVAAQRQAGYEQAQAEAALAATKSVESFREAHSDAFPAGDEGDKAFMDFYQNTYVPSGVVDLETAYKIHDYDGAQARARQAAQGEVDAVDDEKRQASSTVVPGSHTPEVWTGDRNDENFEGARERSKSRYNLGLSKDY